MGGFEGCNNINTSTQSEMLSEILTYQNKFMQAIKHCYTQKLNPQKYLPQSSSSAWSRQSCSPSHTYQLGMQCLVSHSNWLLSQSRGGGTVPADRNRY